MTYTHCPACNRERATMKVYDNGSSHCHACGYHETTKTTKTFMKLPQLESFEWGSRALSTKVLDLYGVGLDSSGRVVSPHYSPTMELLALHSRTPGERDFRMQGSNVPFGLHTLGNNKELVICEGHTDTLSAKQMLPHCDAIGVPGSKTVNTLKEYLSYIRKYKRITIVMDADKAGEEATETLLEILPASKTRVVTLDDGFDINLYLTNEDTDGFLARYNSAVSVKSDIFVTDEDCERYADESDADVISTGIPELDTLIGGGFGVGELSIVTGYTGTGKSALSQMLAVNAAKAGVKVLYLAGEMTPKQNLKRLAKQWCGGLLRKEEVASIYKKVKEYILIYKGSDLSIDSVCDTINRAVSDHDAKLVIVDVLSDIEGFNDDYKVAASAIKRLHKASMGSQLDEIPDCAIVCVGHTKGADDGPISINSLRGGASIRQDAALIVGFSEEEQGNHKNTNRIGKLLKKPRNRDFEPDPITLSYNPLNGHYTGDTQRYEKTTDKVRFTPRRTVSQAVPTSDAPPEHASRLGVTPTSEELRGNQEPVNDYSGTTTPIEPSEPLRTGLLLPNDTDVCGDKGNPPGSGQNEVSASGEDAPGQDVQTSGVSEQLVSNSPKDFTSPTKQHDSQREHELNKLRSMYEKHPDILKRHRAIKQTNDAIRRNLIDLGYEAE